MILLSESPYKASGNRVWTVLRFVFTTLLPLRWVTGSSSIWNTPVSRNVLEFGKSVQSSCSALQRLVFWGVAKPPILSTHANLFQCGEKYLSEKRHDYANKPRHSGKPLASLICASGNSLSSKLPGCWMCTFCSIKMIVEIINIDI